MIIYIQYHVASGQIGSQVLTRTAETLPAYAREGHDFLESNEVIAGKFIDGGQLADQTEVMLTVPDRAGLGEVVVVTGLPDHCWVELDYQDFVEVTGGAISMRQNEHGRRHFRLVGRYTSEVYTISFDDLGDVIRDATTEIDNQAEAARARVITPGAGQAMTYLRKADAARGYQAGETISEAQMRRLVEESTLGGVSVDDAASAIIAIADAWENLDAEIDAIRLRSKKAVIGATSATEIKTILDTIIWPV